MAIGDDAITAGFDLVPENGEQGKVKYGAREINRTRDMIAKVLNSIPKGKSGARTAAGIYSGSANPANSLGENGDLYFKVL